MDVSVDYYRDCAETKPYLTKVFANQLGSAAIDSAMQATLVHWWSTRTMPNP